MGMDRALRHPPRRCTVVEVHTWLDGSLHSITAEDTELIVEEIKVRGYRVALFFVAII